MFAPSEQVAQAAQRAPTMAFELRWKLLLPLLFLAVLLALVPALSGPGGEAQSPPGGRAAAGLSDEAPLVPDSIVP